MNNMNRNFERAKNEEENVAWILEYITGRKVILMPTYSAFDYVFAKVVDGNNVATCLAEYRGRPDTKKDAYPSIIIDRDKVEKMHAAARVMDMKQCILIAQWEDTPEPLWADISEETMRGVPTRTVERNNPRVGDFAKEVYDIPILAFREFRNGA